MVKWLPILTPGLADISPRVDTGVLVLCLWGQHPGPSISTTLHAPWLSGLGLGGCAATQWRMPTFPQVPRVLRLSQSQLFNPVLIGSIHPQGVPVCPLLSAMSWAAGSHSLLPEETGLRQLPLPKLLLWLLRFCFFLAFLPLLYQSYLLLLSLLLFGLLFLNRSSQIYSRG